MKVSILIPSLDRDYLLELLPQIPTQDTEIVVCSPYQPDVPGVVWANDIAMAGNNRAMRQAFHFSRGEVVVCLCDDIVLEPGWLEQGLALLGDGDGIVALSPLQPCECFGKLYANFAVARRATVKNYWPGFYPYHSHWGDVAFSLAVWAGGGRVIPTPTPLVRFRDRADHPEPPHKSGTFISDCDHFLADFNREAFRWMRDNWRLFNRPTQEL